MARTLTTVQSVLVCRRCHPTRAGAERWILEHGYDPTQLDETEKFWRFRQRSPGDFSARSFRTIRPAKSIAMVVGHLRRR